MKSVIAQNKSEHGQSALDAYTPIHFAVGFVAGIYGISPIRAALGLTVLKIGVAAYERGAQHALFSRSRGESNLNELCDLLCEIGGVALGARVRSKWNPNPTIPAADPTSPAAPAAGLGILSLR